MSLQKEMFETKCDLVVLGLDLSLNGTGGVVLEPDGSNGVVFTAGRKLKENASPKERIHRLIDIWQSIWSLAFVRRRDQKLQIPQLVGIEGYAYKALGRGKEVAELHGLVKVMLCEQANIDADCIYIMSPTSVKKEVFGHGGLDKKEIKVVVDTLRRDKVITGVELSNHNERDAWAIAQCVRRKHG